MTGRDGSTDNDQIGIAKAILVVLLREGEELIKMSRGRPGQPGKTSHSSVWTRGAKVSLVVMKLPEGGDTTTSQNRGLEDAHNFRGPVPLRPACNV